MAKTVANRIPAETSLTSADSAPAAERNLAPAQWEIDARRSGWLPALFSEWHDDTDYLLARLRRALGTARDTAAPYRTGEFADRNLADSIELELLRGKIDNLILELRPYGRAGEEMLAVLRQVAPALTWVQSAGGLLGVALGTAAERDVDTIAAHLRLREDMDRGARIADYRYWVGMHEGWKVTVTGPKHPPVMHDAVTHASERDA
ncbi:hypothetical protein NONO_c61070 [Nocardia nova SH22a]|uniref:Uncharacterized protein n=1 Tax=Nocardia nova SH22a TaxID=1415166 RepID=W5TPP7_9NOCA|nr:hypothetical protein [Nocardia nova]AHH20883.1 hypothetical protein NONO_c61070 [Nocardia nova SH22a]